MSQPMEAQDSQDTQAQAPDAPVETPKPQSLGLLSSHDESPRTEAVDTPTNRDWVSFLSEENRDKPYLKDFKSADDLLKSYENQRSLIGKRLEDFSPEQLETYRAKLGVPESPEAYKLTLPEEMKKDGLNEDWFRQTMRDANVPQKEAQVLFNKYAEHVNTQMQAMQKAREQAVAEGQAELDKVYGTAKTQRIQGIVSFMRDAGGDEILETFNNSDLATNPKFVQFLGRMAELAAEDRGVNISQSKSWGTTPSEALAEIDNLKRDPDFLSKVANDAQFKERWMKLHQLAYPE